MKTWIIEIMRKLQDPNLVARFQNRFGVFRIEPSENGPEELPSQPTIQNPTKKCIDDQFQVDANDKECQTCPHTVTNFMWYYIFSFGTSLGYEMFYAVFFPFWVWNLDSAVCRKVVNVWVFIMYIGQALKDVIQWPRPASPPVVSMEPKYVVEYGMPSTHAMVGVTLPFSILYFTVNRYEYPIMVGLCIATVWCALVCCSRLYMGMHTVLDIIGGLLLAPALMLVILPISDSIDHFQQKNNYSPVVTIAVMILLQMLYPKTSHWSPARGDTTVIMGTGAGFAFGTWLNYHLGVVYEPYSFVPYVINFPNLQVIIMSILRTVVGLLCIGITRQIFKTLLHIFLCYIMRLDHKDPRSRRKVVVEIPNKFITYIAIGFVIVYFAPLVFRNIGIERNSMHFEV